MFGHRRQRTLCLTLVFLLLVSFAVLAQEAAPKNIILLIGDGMGITHITAARIASGSPDEVLNLDTMAVTGLAKTHSASSLVTDSAAAGTALATGVRTNNERLALAPDGRALKSLMLMAGDRGLGTGVVVTSKLTDATPAAFLVQSASRAFENEIAEQIVHSGVNILLGGGSDAFGAHPFTRQPRGSSLLSEAIANGYLYIKDKTELLELKPEPNQNLLGLFSTGNLSYHEERFPTEPSLAEMTATALQFLDLYQAGFFLMVEGSKIDKGSHYNLTEEVLGDTIAFDQAVGVALDYAREHGNTLVIVTADHETGGFGIVGGTPDGQRVAHDWLSTDHTGAMVAVYADGPGQNLFTGTHHLTELSQKMADLLGFAPFPAYLDQQEEAKAPRRVIFVIIDGFDPSYFEFGLPNIEAFAQDGVWVKEAKTIMPAATTAAMTSLITGCYPKTHGVPNNVYYDPILNVRRESPRDVQVPNIGELFQAAGFSTMSVNHFMMDKGTDVQITGGWNTVTSRLKAEAPGLLVFIEQTPDAVGHQRGAKSQEMAGAMKRADRSFGKLMETIKDLDLYEDSLIILTADHGMTHIEDNKRLPAQTIARALTLPGVKMEYLGSGETPADDTDLLWFHMVTGAAVVYRNPISPQQEEMLINNLLAVPGVHSVWAQDEIDAAGIHPLVANLWINLEDGFGLAAHEMGGHSSIFQQSVPLIIRGPGVKQNEVISGISGIKTIDVAPTILHLMGLEIPETMDGRVLEELLRH